MRWLLRIVLAVVVLAVLLWFGAPLVLRRSVMPYEGTVRTAVQAPVEITFDARGIPQIWAKTDRDAFFAIGFLHAGERLFQMELVRRLSRGELSEVFGEAAYETDVFQRQIGFARRARAADLDAGTRAVLQSYVDGVNAGIRAARMLPPEFVILNLEPREWTLEDCLAAANYQTWFSHQLMDKDRKYQKIIEKLGLPGSALSKAGHAWSPPSVPDLSITRASNSWAVAPAQSTTGAALHASDPHLSIDQAPGLWYLAGLHSEEGLDVVGATYAGAPFVLMGHNRDIAFSFTVASVDLIDYFDDRPVRSIREEIRVKGESKPRVLEIHEGIRGPMIDESTSLHWAGFDFAPARIPAAALRLQKAGTFDEFRAAVTSLGALDANWVYSDRSGNIGYQLGAPIPIRELDTYVRQKASDPASAWRGYRGLNETPMALNPARGFLASCNNQPVGRSWPYAIPGFYDPYRITRAEALLANRKHSPQDAARMQLDLTSGLAHRWKGLAAEGAKKAGLRPEAAQLAAWNGASTADSKEATLFAAWWRMLPKAVFEDELGADWNEGRALLEEALTANTAIDDRRTAAIESAVDVSAIAMREAKGIAAGRTWGEACTLVVRHPLSRVKILDTFLELNRGPYPSAGDAGTLNANFYDFEPEDRSFRARVGPSMRFVLDWSDPDTFTMNGALGQSGNPFSPHYADFLPMMQKGERWTLPFSRAKVFATKASVLRLEP